MMYNVIQNFHRQFEFTPIIQNRAHFHRAKKFIITGMGGSQLSAELLKTFDTKIEITLHKDYALPRLPYEELEQRLVIASSYSGDTEETIDSFEEARRKKLAVLVISTGGKLLSLARRYKMPYIQLPNIGIQPRSALGFSFMALLKAIGQDKMRKEAAKLAHTLKPAKFKKQGRLLAKKLKGFIPVIYASTQNYGLAYNWKIKLNETGKIPAFCNVIPELNHNEMNAFDVTKGVKSLCGKFYFIFMKDPRDHPRIHKRMSIQEKMYKMRKLQVTSIELKGKNPFQKIFSSIVLADWTSYYTAQEYGLDPNEVPMVEEFKNILTAGRLG